MDAPTNPAKTRQMVAFALFEETVLMVQNILGINERDTVARAGYSPGAQNHWKREGEAPLVAVNALRGLLVGRDLAKAEADHLRLTVDELLALANECSNPALRAALYREIARRVEDSK